MKNRLTAHLFFYCLIFTTLVFLSFPVILEAQKHQRPFDFLKKTIVIDPGHGGRDKGARGPEGTLEKTVTLVLSRMIAAELENNYQVVLTRTGDYMLNIPERTATANHLKADLFISIHAGGSILHTVNERSLFYFKELKHAAVSDKNDPDNELTEITVPWNKLQSKHQIRSRKLAEIMKNHLAQDAEIPVQIYNAPLLILGGADMPAILLEIGYLTNPAQEKGFNDKETLYDMAKKITSGINAFLTLQK